VYDKTYPPNTTDYTPIVRAIKATNPEIVFVASYPPDSVGMLRAAHEVGLQPKMFGVELTRFRGGFTAGDHAGVSSRVSYAMGDR
jgi:ABC-type branched-subunit amino acid transport system substrate-binding protein